jgi:hypothetical protein
MLALLVLLGFILDVTLFTNPPTLIFTELAPAAYIVWCVFKTREQIIEDIAASLIAGGIAILAFELVAQWLGGLLFFPVYIAVKVAAYKKVRSPGFVQDLVWGRAGAVDPQESPPVDRWK